MQLILEDVYYIIVRYKLRMSGPNAMRWAFTRAVLKKRRPGQCIAFLGREVRALTIDYQPRSLIGALVTVRGDK